MAFAVPPEHNPHVCTRTQSDRAMKSSIQSDREQSKRNATNLRGNGNLRKRLKEMSKTRTAERQRRVQWWIRAFHKCETWLRDDFQIPQILTHASTFFSHPRISTRRNRSYQRALRAELLSSRILLVGDLDPTFDGDGLVRTDFGGF